MVKIAIAGGSSGVGREIVDSLVSRDKHDIILLSRQDKPKVIPSSTAWVKTNYNDPIELAATLRDVHTVLCFIVTSTDPGNQAQLNLINAAIEAGVKRYAPSEWSCVCFDNQSWSVGKVEIRNYLKDLNKNEKILEYSLFQPGLFTDYLAYPHHTTKHIPPIQTPIDFENRRLLMPEGAGDASIALTTAQDLAGVVTRAVEYEGEWPVIGGMRGSKLTINQLISLGKTIRGGIFKVDRLGVDDLRTGKPKASWLPHVGHSAFSHEEFDALSGYLVSGILLGIASGEFQVSDEWNRLLPDYSFVGAEAFLENVWHGKS